MLVLEALNPYYENMEHNEDIKKVWEKFKKKQTFYHLFPFATITKGKRQSGDRNRNMN